MLAVRFFSQGVWEAEVELDGQKAKALGYTELVGTAEAGCEVLLNTTAVELGLGTGGYHFVTAVYPHKEAGIKGPGHIMKLRYTPSQLRVLSVEEEASRYHDVFSEWRTLEGMPVVVGTLHSMLAPFVIVLRRLDPTLKIVYVMTDGGALPQLFSRTVFELKNRGWLHSTVTFGHAFGGDFEAVNVYSALVAAKYAAGADLAVVLMGPGVVGTGTVLGTTAMEQAPILDAALTLQGQAVAVPRLSMEDKRERHRGISHHTLTVLGKLVNGRCLLPMPDLPDSVKSLILDQLEISGVRQKHQLRWYDTRAAFDWLAASDMTFSTMGRGLLDDPLFFEGVAAAALCTHEILRR